MIIEPMARYAPEIAADIYAQLVDGVLLVAT